MKNPKENISQLILTLIGLISAFWVSKLANNEGDNFIIISILLIALAIIVWFFTNLINLRIIEISEERIRAQYNFEAKINGLWIENYTVPDQGARYALIDIIFDNTSQTLT